MARLTLGLALVTLLCAADAAAQIGSTPRVEIAGGYSYVRSRTVTSLGFNMHGGSGSVAVNVNDWLGLVADIGHQTTGNVPPPGSGFTLNTTSYLFGPRISYRRERVTLFAHELLGGSHAGGTLYTQGFQQTSAPPSAQNSFAMALGGGVDYNITRRFAIRTVQADWLYTLFPNGAANRQSSLRLTFGVVFRFGG